MDKQQISEEMWRILSEEIPSDRIVIMENETIPALLEAIADAEISAEVVKKRISDLQGRKARFDAQAESLRNLLCRWMEESGQHTLRLPIATVSLIPGSPFLRVTDVEQLPAEYSRVEKTADKTALRAAARNGIHVPGTVWGNNAGSIRIRRT